MDFISHELQNGSFDVLKVLYLTQPISLQTAKALCSGNAFVPVFRPGPWNSKKAIQWLLSRLGGYQVRWHALQEKTAAEAQSQSDTPKWNPATHELEEGVALINEHAPDCDGRNEQALWILISIKADSGTPIAGWPEHKVRMMAQNKSRGGGDNFQSQAIRAGCPTSLPVLSTPALRHCALGLPRCGEDTLCHCDVHGVGSVSCSLQ